MPRYTRKMLTEELNQINASLAGTGYYLAAQGRNGYTGLDEYRGDPSEGTAGHCMRNIECGTPKDCAIAARFYEAPETKSRVANHKSPFGPM